MSAIEVTEMYPRCRRRNATCDEDYNASLDEIRALLREGWYVGIYVDGWTEPWGCWIDDNAQLRAVCPTSPTRISPKVVQVSYQGAVLRLDAEEPYDTIDCVEEPTVQVQPDHERIVRDMAANPTLRSMLSSRQYYPGCVSDEWVQDGGESLEDDAGCDEEPKP